MDNDDVIAVSLVSIVLAAILFAIFWPPMPSIETELQRIAQERGRY